MVDASPFGDASSGYKRNVLAGLTERQMLERGLHGVTVYLTRASAAAASTDPGGPMPRAAQWAARADHLLVFLARVAHPDTELGRKLVQCYTGIQGLIAAALAGKRSAFDDTLQRAIVESRALERVMVQNGISGDQHG